jgi:methyl coenzyme M reductase subunit C-like uncharacterized protein (methanogenesis marker protein 7)
VDQRLALAAGPDAAVDIAIAQHILAPAHAGHQVTDVVESLRRITLDLGNLDRYGIFGNAGRVAQTATNEDGVEFARIDDALFYILVDGRLDGGAETRAHVDRIGA